MEYKAVFNGWDNLNLYDLIVAFRKAKADCFYENSFPTAIKFAEYEQSLLENLKSLLNKLQTDNGFQGNNSLLGKCHILPKKLDIKPKYCSDNGHTHFSNPDRAFDSLHKNNDLTPEFRIVGDFPVDTHVISALWINMIGHKFDALVDESSYGARLRRIRNEELLDSDKFKSFHITAVGSFKPYFQPYQKWRKNGLKSIREELEKDRKIIAVSLDLQSYYHLIDPAFIASDDFQDEVGFAGENALSDLDKNFTKQLSLFLKKWANQASEFAQKLTSKTDDATVINGGLVIGLTATRVISNILLHKWDKLIKEKVVPVYYGRYVDDMFLVLHDPGTITDIHQLMEYLQDRVGKKRICKIGDYWEINLDGNYQNKTLIRLQEKKQKLFILQGQAGCDLLDSIEKEMQELSSEHRLMPTPDQLEQSTAARVLSASTSAGEQADTLRRADGLTIRRLSWTLQLRHVEILARDLPKHVWQKERNEFYQFSHNHILRPDRIFEHYVCLSRLLGFAISINEWKQALTIFTQTLASLDRLAVNLGIGKPICINGSECFVGKELWSYVKRTLLCGFIDAAAKYYDPSLLKNKPPKLANIFISKIWNMLSLDDQKSVKDTLGFSLDIDGDFYKKAFLLVTADLANTPYKIALLNKQLARNFKEKFDVENERDILDEFKMTKLLDTDILEEFLKATKNPKLSTEIFRPYLFPTRPYTPKEIAETAVECVYMKKKGEITSQTIWAKYVRVLRGVWVKPTLLEIKSGSAKKNKLAAELNNSRKIKIGTLEKNSVVVAITSLLTSDLAWKSSAWDDPHLTLDRYKRIAKLVNEAIKLKPRPDYLIFPELSMPIQWVHSVGNRLIKSGISLIAGTEYRHKNNKIFSEACLELTDNRLGYPSSVRIWQAKQEPAVREDFDLMSKYGKVWWKNSKNNIRHVYNHNNFHFGVMICSEIQNTKERIAFQGQVDALMVLAWNKDLDTFSSLIESAALDIHAYIVMVNNREYGDSRVRSPSKQSFKRDLARLRGGENDFLVTVELELDKLRAFQSRTKRWPNDDDPFKPVPEGFQIAKTGREFPPE